jgi:hypothetical protein
MDIKVDFEKLHEAITNYKNVTMLIDKKTNRVNITRGTETYEFDDKLLCEDILEALKSYKVRLKEAIHNNPFIVRGD